MTVKDIVDLLPKGHPFRLEVANLWTALIYKDDCAEYNRVMQEYGDYNVIVIEASFGVGEYAVLWLKVEKPLDNNPYKILNHPLFKGEDFNYLETYKHYTILKASLNAHNSEYVIVELGFETRWSSLTYCKKYIREQLEGEE